MYFCILSVINFILIIETQLLKIYGNPYTQNPSPSWTVFPDADGNIHNISLEIPKNLPFVLDGLPKNIEFRLFTRRNPQNPQVIGGIALLNLTYFDQLLTTKIIIHGWRGSGTGTYVTKLKNSYLSTFDVNVIIVDWNQVANLPYPFARFGIVPIALEVANFVNFLVYGKGATLTNIHIIGHSLGAHIAGLIGKEIILGKLGCILGIDPALPLFNPEDKSTRLDIGDADYVEVIHSTGGFLGFLNPLGHADFYPNGGRSQPGCSYDITGFCSHIESVLYFDESIRVSNSFRATKCDNYQEVLKGACFDGGDYQKMGEPLTKKRNFGIFWLQTSDKSPYSLS